jgi:hypothetical protein
MVRDSLIKHKEDVVICEESGPIIANYNALITHPKSKPITQPIITYTTTKQPLTYSNCGETHHVKKTRCHNRKIKEHVALIVSTKVKLARVLLRFPSIICSSSKHHAPNYPRRIKIRNIF